MLFIWYLWAVKYYRVQAEKLEFDLKHFGGQAPAGTMLVFINKSPKRTMIAHLSQSMYLYVSVGTDVSKCKGQTMTLMSSTHICLHVLTQ